MGLDGGSAPTQRSCLPTSKQKENTTSLSVATREYKMQCWSVCALSQEYLSSPVVACGKGVLYNKANILRYIIARKHEERVVFSKKEQSCEWNEGRISVASSNKKVELARTPKQVLHIEQRRDYIELRLTPKDSTVPARTPTSTEDALNQWICPITRECINGINRFVFFAPCGHVVSYKAVRLLTGPNTSYNSSSLCTGENTIPANGKSSRISCPCCLTDTNNVLREKQAPSMHYFHIALETDADREEQLEQFRQEVNARWSTTSQLLRESERTKRIRE